MKGTKSVLLLLLITQSAHATLMTAGSLQIMSTLVASAGQPPQVTGSIELSQIVAPTPGTYVPRSHFYSCGIANTIYGQGSAVQLTVPAGAVAADFYPIITQQPFATPGFDPSSIQIANQKAIAQGGLYRQPIPNGIFQIAAYDPGGNILNGQFNQPATLSLSVPNSTNGNAIGGTSPQIRLDSLSLWMLDPDQMIWRNLPNSSVNVNNQVVSANAPGFGVYAIMGAADTALNQIVVYPVPWRPHSGNPLNGTDIGGITFGELPSDCTIQIFTTAGQLVKEIQHGGGTSTENWDVKTSGGTNVASGLYLYLITNSSGHKTGKLIVIR